MEFLGVGPLELFFILIIALIFLGPRDMVKTGRTMGKYLRKIVMSPTWRMVQQTSRELRTLPNRMIREAGMEEDVKDLDELRKDVGNQIGSLRKPFSAAASEVDQNLREAQSDLTPKIEPATQGVLAAWTTPPATAEPAAGSIDETPAGQNPVTSDTSPGAAPAKTETPNSNEPLI
jgi:Sec-independent protein translocase protein TatA